MSRDNIRDEFVSEEGPSGRASALRQLERSLSIPCRVFLVRPRDVRRLWRYDHIELRIRRLHNLDINPS